MLFLVITARGFVCLATHPPMPRFLLQAAAVAGLQAGEEVRLLSAFLLPYPAAHGRFRVRDTLSGCRRGCASSTGFQRQR